MHDGWLPRDSEADRSSTPDSAGFTERLLWCDGDGRTLLREHRTVSAAARDARLGTPFPVRVVGSRPSVVVLGSPATNGRTGGAGYGGFFWRATEGSAAAFTESSDEPNGSAEPWLALTVDGDYTLVFRGLAGADRWFVRTGEYAGVCAALAFDQPLTVEPGTTLTRDVRVLVADGVLTREQIRAAVTPDRPLPLTGPYPDRRRAAPLPARRRRLGRSAPSVIPARTDRKHAVGGFSPPECAGSAVPWPTGGRVPTAAASSPRPGGPPC